MKKFIISFYWLLFKSFLSRKIKPRSFSLKIYTKFLEGFKKLLSIPNDANDKIGIQKNIEWTEKEFGKRGFTVSKIMTKGAPLLLLKEILPQKAKRSSYTFKWTDSQWTPQNGIKKSIFPSIEKKNSSGDWEAINWEKIYEYNDDWRIFARSSSDAKGQFQCLLQQLTRLMRMESLPTST